MVTSVQEGSPAATQCVVLSRKNVKFEILSGDELVSVGGRVFDADTTQAEMRQSFVGAGRQVVLVLSRPGLAQQQPGGLRRWASKARRSMSVDVRAMTKTWFAAQPQPTLAPPSEAVKLSNRIFAAAGGSGVDPGALVASVEAQLETHPPSDDMLDETASRVLFLNVGERGTFHSPNAEGRVLDLGWEAPLGSSTPTLDFVARLGLAACAWLDLDKRTAVVVCDAPRGDRTRLGLATAVVLRVSASVLGEVSADASVEAYDAYVKAIGGPHSLAIDKLPPSLSRSLRHVDFAVEARRLPNDKALALLGVSVSGLPLSDPPVLKVSNSPNTFVWSSGDAIQNVVDWDGDEAFYSIEDCVVKGDFCVVVRFGGAYGAQFTQDQSSSTIIRYVASTAFLSDGAIDARSSDVDVHPAYSEQLGKEDDFRIRFAFRYVEDENHDDDAFFLPFDRDEAVYQGLNVIAQVHSVREPDQAKLAQLPVTDPLIAKLALQLGNNDLDAAFKTIAHLHRLEDLSILAQQRAANREYGLQQRPRQQPQVDHITKNVSAPSADDGHGDDDELDAKGVVVEDSAPPRTVAAAAAPPPQRQRVFGKGKRNKRRTESLPPQKAVGPPPSIETDEETFVFVGRETDQVSDESLAPPRPGDESADYRAPFATASKDTVEEVISRQSLSHGKSASTPLGKSISAVDQSKTAKSLDPAAPVVATLGDHHLAPKSSSPDTKTLETNAVATSRTETGHPALKEDTKESKAAALEAGLAAKFGNAPKQEASPPRENEPTKRASTAAALESGLAEKFGATRPASVSPAQKKEGAPASTAAALEAGLAAKFGGSATSTAVQGTNKHTSKEDLSASSGVPLGQHPAMKQWAKLLKVGLPKGAVAKKMTEEGMNPALLDMDLSKPATPEAMAMLRGESDPAAGGGKGGPTSKREWGKSKKATIGKRQSLKPVHWEPLAGEDTEGTVWAASESRSVDESEKAELKRLFAAKPTAAKLPKAKKAAESQSAGVEACDGKRAANVAIGLQALSKKFDGDLSRIARAARDLDTEALSLENVAQLTPLLPSDAEDTETRRIFFSTEKKEPKRLAESFFVAVARVVDEKENGVESVETLRTRLGILSDYLSADEASRKLESDSQAIETAATAARESAALAEAFQRLLTLGNALNEGTHRGGAAGFTLASLKRLATTKSADSGESVLDFAARKPLDAEDSSLEALAGPLKMARKFSLNELGADLDRLNKTAKALASTSRSKAADCAAKADRGRAALDRAAEQAATTAKFFGEEASIELSELFGTLAEFVDDFSQARSKAAAQQQRENNAAATTPGATLPTPKAASQKRETRTKARSRHGLSVDDMLKTTPPKVRR